MGVKIEDIIRLWGIGHTATLEHRGSAREDRQLEKDSNAVASLWLSITSAVHKLSLDSKTNFQHNKQYVFRLSRAGV